MNIAIIGNDTAFNEAKFKLGESHQYFHADVINHCIDLDSVEIIFDFNTAWNAEATHLYKSTAAPIFLNTIFTTLATTKLQIQSKASVFGFCGLPTFFNRDLSEVVVSTDSEKAQVEEILKKLKLDFRLVKDQVGMITPRVVCMIINEAYEALQQGVASREDIDLSMKLGTNYPYGPFEWGDKIGLENLKKLMLALQMATNESRFNPNF